ncbi:MAG: HAD-IA family hydrolase [Spirochaetales bacterium]|nr:HAD-IA family hydrolase [Spirochaetales bacterium]
MSGIRAVVFDFGNVLANVERLKICARLAEHSPLTGQEVCAHIYGTDIELESETGRYDSRGHFQRIKERIQADGGWSFEEFREEFKEGFSLNPEGMNALRLAARSKRVFILSNIPYLHSLWLYEQEELATLPEQHIFSFKVGVMKPDPGIWQALLERSRLEAGQCVYVDDVEDFCAAAGRLGFKTLHYRKGETDLVGELEKWL